MKFRFLRHHFPSHFGVISEGERGILLHQLHAEPDKAMTEKGLPFLEPVSAT
jgi:hypothetical protein